LVRFWTVETNRYNSQTQLRVRSKTGTAGSTSAGLFRAGKNFGRSLSETNYNESISDSLVVIVEALFSDGDFSGPGLKNHPPSGRGQKAPRCRLHSTAAGETRRVREEYLFTGLPET